MQFMIRPHTRRGAIGGTLIAVAILLAACQLVLTPSPEPTPEGDDMSRAVTAVATDDHAATQLMYSLSEGEFAEVQEALRIIRASHDERFVPVLIELLRSAQIGLVPPHREYVETLGELSGQPFGQDWGTWVEWYGATDLVPPPGFTTWKGRMLSAIDPGFEEFLRDDLPSNIRVEEIAWGGVRVDGIPALDNPAMLSAADATYLANTDPVFGIAINGDARAYPLRILDWHEMANDVVGDVPVSLAYCTLCGAAIAYDGRSTNASGEPTTYDFGSSGFLFRSNKLMYDRQTRTLWNQLTGESSTGRIGGQ